MAVAAIAIAETRILITIFETLCRGESGTSLDGAEAQKVALKITQISG
jgi:hypothetical protein